MIMDHVLTTPCNPITIYLLCRHMLKKEEERKKMTEHLVNKLNIKSCH